MILFLVISFLLIISSCVSVDIPCLKERKDFGYVCKCNSNYCDTIGRPEKLPSGYFHFYSTSDKNPGFNHQYGFFSTRPSLGMPAIKFKVDRTKTYQKIRGFGGSFTDAFGVVIYNLTEGLKQNIFNSYFSEEGIEYTIARAVIAYSDFSVHNYTYVPNYDQLLQSFNLTTDDYLYKIEPMKRAMGVSKKPITFFASPFNTPDWMKVRISDKSTYLKPIYRQIWANYLVKYIKEMKKEGIDIWALTVANQPFTNVFIPFMKVLIMLPEEQREFISKNLGPALEKNGLKTKIIAMDDMRLYINYWMDSLMRDKTVEQYLIGVGLHYYFDEFFSPTDSDEFHERYPNQEIMYTESSFNGFSKKYTKDNESNGLPILGAWSVGAYYAKNILENLNHWTTAYVDWNLALNLQGGPNLNHVICDSSIIVNDTSNDEFYKQPLFYVMGHFSKFIQPDSIIISIQKANGNLRLRKSLDNKYAQDKINKKPIRLDFPNLVPDDNIQFVGALNSNGSISIIIFNPRDESASIDIYDPLRGHAVLTLEPNSINTILYW